MYPAVVWRSCKGKNWAFPVFLDQYFSPNIIANLFQRCWALFAAFILAGPHVLHIYFSICLFLCIYLFILLYLIHLFIIFYLIHLFVGYLFIHYICLRFAAAQGSVYWLFLTSQAQMSFLRDQRSSATGEQPQTRRRWEPSPFQAFGQDFIQQKQLRYQEKTTKPSIFWYFLELLFFIIILTTVAEICHRDRGEFPMVRESRRRGEGEPPAGEGIEAGSGGKQDMLRRCDVEKQTYHGMSNAPHHPPPRKKRTNTSKIWTKFGVGRWDSLTFWWERLPDRCEVLISPPSILPQEVLRKNPGCWKLKGLFPQWFPSRKWWPNSSKKGSLLLVPWDSKTARCQEFPCSKGNSFFQPPSVSGANCWFSGGF